MRFWRMKKIDKISAPVKTMSFVVENSTKGRPKKTWKKIVDKVILERV